MCIHLYNQLPRIYFLIIANTDYLFEFFNRYFAHLLASYRVNNYVFRTHITHLSRACPVLQLDGVLTGYAFDPTMGLPPALTPNLNPLAPPAPFTMLHPFHVTTFSTCQG